MRIQRQNNKSAEWDTLTDDNSVRIVSVEKPFILIEITRLDAKGDIELYRLRLNAREVNWFYQKASAARFYADENTLGVL